MIRVLAHILTTCLHFLTVSNIVLVSATLCRTHLIYHFNVFLALLVHIKLNIKIFPVDTPSGVSAFGGCMLVTPTYKHTFHQQILALSQHFSGSNTTTFSFFLNQPFSRITPASIAKDLF